MEKNLVYFRMKNILITISPMILGGMIYIFLRPEQQLFESLIIVDMSQVNSIDWLPDWIKYSLPDFCWLFSFAYSLLLIPWPAKSRSRLIYLSIPIVIAIGSEVLQLYNLIQGTFDYGDILAYLTGYIASFIIYGKLNRYEN